MKIHDATNYKSKERNDFVKAVAINIGVIICASSIFSQKLEFISLAVLALLIMNFSAFSIAASILGAIICIIPTVIFELPDNSLLVIKIQVVSLLLVRVIFMLLRYYPLSKFSSKSGKTLN